MFTASIACRVTHRWTQCSLHDGLCIGHIILLAFDGWLSVDRWDQPHVVTQLLKFPVPAMRRRTRIHGDRAFGLLRHERKKLTS
jgi:hypothetical protein